MFLIKYLKRKINNLNEFGFYIFFIQILHKIIYGRNLNDRVVQFLSEERLKKYLDKYSYVWANNKSEFEKQIVIPKEDIIWTMWLQGENNAPLLIRKCINSIREKCNGFFEVIDLAAAKDVTMEEFKAFFEMREKLAESLKRNKDS